MFVATHFDFLQPGKPANTVVYMSYIVAGLQCFEFFEGKGFALGKAFFGLIAVKTVKNLVIGVAGQFALIVHKATPEGNVQRLEFNIRVNLVENGPEPFGLFDGIGDNYIGETVGEVVLQVFGQQFEILVKRRLWGSLKIEYINRFKTTQQIKETLKRVAEGETNVLIGTHRIVSSDIKFKDLGLLIVDEEQKFGVKTKDKLKEMRVNVDVLTLTATPIPRTLQFSLLGARDLSIIATPPPNRQPVTTELHVYNEALVRDSIRHELQRSGQVFFVHNRIGDIEEMANVVLRLVPDAKVAIAHGQMEGGKLEKVMLNFIEGEYDVLVCTNIIESGLDIPNANTIIINRAHQFGLSDLHQMRGRVGRSNKKAYCYLFIPTASALTPEARRRLTALEEFSDLGEGFKIAMRDLDIRGAGNLLGAEQSGFISDLGFELYYDILDKAIQELKEEEFKDLFVKELPLVKELVTDCVIETDLPIFSASQRSFTTSTKSFTSSGIGPNRSMTD